jgi:hypothetical protein
VASAQELLDNPRLDECTTSAAPHNEEEVTLPDRSLCHLALILSINVAAQKASSMWVRARAPGAYLVVYQGGTALAASSGEMIDQAHDRGKA